MASTIVINGKRITVAGNDISIVNGELRVDGKKVDTGNALKDVVEIKWEGPLANLTTDVSVSCEDVKGSVKAGSHVVCYSVGGDVDAGSHVSCDDVGGNVTAGSHVTCDDVAGNVTAGSRVSRS